MVAPLPAPGSQGITFRRRANRHAWLLWILVSVIGAVVGAAISWQIRWAFFRSPATTQLLVAYIATTASALVVSGGQWFVLGRYRLDVYWWVPATVAGNLVAAAIIVPSVTNLAFARGVTPINAETAVFYGVIAVATSAIVVGTAQALVLRRSAGNIAWAWIPATTVGGALTGAITTALANELMSIAWLLDHPVALVALVSAIGSLLVSACQAPVISRMLR
ncbi:MAG TPA: hypothetical protein VFR68_01100 [Candidatus Dormibacteraeota bacterium]|nr:hypothetical protein [Candidatus Dormibacteraeota bacterium]